VTHQTVYNSVRFGRILSHDVLTEP